MGHGAIPILGKGQAPKRTIVAVCDTTLPGDWQPVGIVMEHKAGGLLADHPQAVPSRPLRETDLFGLMMLTVGEGLLQYRTLTPEGEMAWVDLPRESQFRLKSEVRTEAEKAQEEKPEAKTLEGLIRDS